MTKGRELKKPRGVIWKFLKAISNEPERSGVISLFTKQINTIVSTMKMLRMKLPNDENLNELNVRGKDTGNTNAN